MAINPRWKTGRRRTYQARFKALGLPCALCGRPIDYSLPYYVTDEQGQKHVNMMAFVIDEKIPISKWEQAGYSSAAECANDFSNLQPCHAICNAMKGNKLNFNMNQNVLQKKEVQANNSKRNFRLDGNW